MADRPSTAPSRRPTNSVTASRNSTTATRATRSVRPSTTTTLLPPPTTTPEAAGGLGGGAIGGIAAGVVVVFALVGLVIYKRRKRSTVGAAKETKSKMMDGPSLSSDATISGPLALAPQTGTSSAPPAHRAEAQYREQQQFKPDMRDKLFAQPGSALHSTPSNKSRQDLRNKEDHFNAPPLHQRNNSNKQRPPSPDDMADYYDAEPPIGAQRATPQPRDVMHGNLTPAPEYYLGKEDIDPRRDLRGLDTPEAYVDQKHRPKEDSPRSSFSSEGGQDSYQTPEQAQQAHNRKMMGHKVSIGSVQMLMEHTPERQAQAHTSIAVSDSTVSMMPALPPTASPSFNPGQRGPGNGPTSPISSVPYEDPYAESAFSSEDFDNRSQVSGGYRPYPGSNYSPQQQPQHGRNPAHQPHYNQHQGGYRPQGGPGYQSGPYQPNNRPQQPPRGNNNYGYGPQSPPPHGQHYNNHSQNYNRGPQHQQGYPQRDPGYQQQQRPYQGGY